jgi:hypothetical protein
MDSVSAYHKERRERAEKRRRKKGRVDMLISEISAQG